MKRVLIFDPSYGTLNLGDNIIVNSTMKQINDLLKDRFVVRVSSHSPMLHFHQVIGRNIYKSELKETDRMFILGSNLLFKNVLFTGKRPWNIHFLTTKNIKNVVLVGVGSNGNSKVSTFYTKMLYKRVLSKNLIHSVRDEPTCKFVKSLGLKAINTGCATMWDLTPDHCMGIPKSKAQRVVFTLTDYAKDKEKDIFLIRTLLKNYETVYFWPQGSNDSSYFHSLGISNENIFELDPRLNVYESLLQEKNIDYVGSRLHGGILALQNKVRTIIVAVDHRALNKKEDYNLVVIDRNDINTKLESLINSEFETKINIDEKKILEWKSQFL